MITKAERNAIINAGLPLPLINAVIKQMGGAQTFIEAAPSIEQAGAQEGYPGFVLFEETVPFAEAHLTALMGAATEDAKRLGISVFGLQGLHKYLPGGTTPQDLAEALHLPCHKLREQAFNALTWYILDQSAHGYCQSRDKAQ